MKSPSAVLRRTCIVSIAATIAALPIAAVSAGQPHIAPIQSHPHGQTYSKWAAEWWQVALEEPMSTNQLLGGNDDFCDQGDVGNVWFLFGLLGGGTITRECEIPVGTALFFPLVNAANLGEAGVDDVESQREANACVEVDTKLYFEFDGEPLIGLDRFLEESPIFDVQFPDEDALFGLNGRVFDQSVDAGFYLFLRPLPPGFYTLHWEASSSCGGSQQDITYNLTIIKGPRR